MKRWIPVVTLLAASIVAAPLALAGDDAKSLYDSKCAMCHGKDGVAKTMAKDSGNFNDPKWQEANSADAIDKVITAGKGKMTAMKERLTPDQIKGLAAYTKTIK